MTIEKILLDRLRELIESSPKHVYMQSDLLELYHVIKTKWGVPSKMTSRAFVDLMVKQKQFKEILFKSSYNKPPRRYVWGDFSPYELALSIQKDAYLSHGTAALLHGLTNEEPDTIYVNKEQSFKPSSGSSLTQDALDRAFSGKQRLSKYLLRYGMLRITLLSGKNTGRLGVEFMKGKRGERLEVTGLERTLIDMTVRPAYAGGVDQVLRCYVLAKRSISAEKLLSTLTELDYVYPYHQAVGFYMERAGYDRDSWAQLKKKMETHHHAFYLTHGMSKKTYDPEWRIFFPTGFGRLDIFLI